jgi:hypothetical protein
MAARRLRSFTTVEVELSPSLRALVSPDKVILFDRARGATVLTDREAQNLAKALPAIFEEFGVKDRSADLSATGSG